MQKRIHNLLSFKRPIPIPVLTISLLCFPWNWPMEVAAQILPDETLPNNSTVSIENTLQRISGGTEAGGNLFHSFSEFNVRTGETAYFDNALTIDNIITRVTGGQLSNIDGLIRANGMANLFLLNPSGLLLGPNARLDIGGSFLGSTADGLWFEDGSFYSATEPNAPPLLTVNVPIGLQLGQNPGEIRVEGTGHRLTSQRDQTSSPLERGGDEGGLQVQPGQTLALVGGNVTLDGGLLTADSGRIEIGSVVGGQVRLTPTLSGGRLGYPEEVQNFGDIQFSSAALVDASGEGGSGIQLVGRRITMTDGSLAFVETRGALPGGDITLQASESIEISGTDPNGLSGGLRTQTVATGDSGAIAISTPSLTLRDGARIYSVSFSQGHGGHITVEAPDSVQIMGASPLGNQPGSDIITNTFDVGNGGNLTLSTNHLSILDGGGLAAINRGTGNGGDVVVKATDSVEVIGFNRVRPAATATRSVITAATQGSGDGGNTTIETARLLVRDGGRVVAATLASGAGGNLTVNASESIEVSGVVEGRPLTSTLSSDAPANLPIQRIRGLPPIPSGDPGTVTIDTPRLLISDRAQVGVDNQGFGDGGDMRITAGEIVLETEGRIAASTVSGEGGNVVLQVRDSLQLRHNSQITAEAGGSGNGGNIAIDTDTLTVLEDSRITANAIQGAGGNIAINTQGIFLSPDSQITASSQLGVDGIVQINNPEVDPSSGLIDLPENFTNTSDRVSTGCADYANSQLVVTGRGGLPEDPTATIRGETVWEDWRNLAGDEVFLDAAPPSIPVLPLDPPQELVEATGWVLRNDGTVDLVAQRGHRGGGRFKRLECGDVWGDRSSATQP